MLKEFGLYMETGSINTTSSFTEEMQHYCGATATIDEMNKFGKIIPSFDDPDLEEESGEWNWDSEMFEPIKSKYPTNRA
jgi:hypothetical protein